MASNIQFKSLLIDFNVYIEYVVARNRTLVKISSMYKRYFSPVTFWCFRKIKEPPFSKLFGILGLWFLPFSTRSLLHSLSLHCRGCVV